jgi:death on curing protein
LQVRIQRPGRFWLGFFFDCCEENFAVSDSQDNEILFLTFEEIEEIHADQLVRYGGQEGYRNKQLIESAVESPRQTMFGQPLYEDIADMASVYLYQIGESQGFTDGNKRTGVAACITFLLVNGYDLDCDELELYDVAMRVANKLLNREGLAAWIRGRIVPVR